jgi:hypothetical protein
MNIVILGILTKTVLLALFAIGVLVAILRHAADQRRRRVLPVPALVLIDFKSPVRLNTRRWIISPSRAPPEMAVSGYSGISAWDRC